MNVAGSFFRASAFFVDQSLEPRSKPTSSAGARPAGNFSVSVADSIEAVEQLRPIWEPWARNPQTDFDYYLYQLRTDPAILSPCVFTVHRDGIPEAVLVALVKNRKLSATISSVSIRYPEVTVLEVVNGGRMGEKSEEIDRLLATQLWRVARNQDVDLLLFHRLSLQSDLFLALRRVLGQAARHRIPAVFSYSVVQLAGSPGRRPQFLSSKQIREARRKTRILERSFPGGVKVMCYSASGDIDRGMREATSIAVTTWQHYLRQDFVSDEQSLDHLSFIAGQGLLRVYILYIEGSPCAFLIGQLYKDTFYCLYAGYNPAFGRFSVGCFLTHWALTDLAGAGVQEVDLGEGGQEHNRRLGCRAQEEGTVHVYLPTMHGILLHAFFGIAQVVRATGRKTLTELRLNRPRKDWLQFLISRWRARNAMSDLCP